MSDSIDRPDLHHRQGAPEDQDRREAVKTLLGGITAITAFHVLPCRWDSPIIEQVFLPAHAATSGSSLHDPCAVELRSGDVKSAEVLVKITGFVTPPTANLPVLVTATAVGGANSKVEGKTTTSSQGTFELFLTVGGGPGITSVNVQTAVAGADGVANCVVHTSASCSNVACTGQEVYASANAQLHMSLLRKAESDDIVEIFWNGTSLGTTDKFVSPASIVIKIGQNTLSSTVTAVHDTRTNPSFVIDSEGSSAKFSMNGGDSNTLCGVCPGTYIQPPS